MINTDATRLVNLLWASGSPVTLWWQTYLKAAETMVAAPQVITHRTARMAQADSAPNLFDQREFAMMGPEKVVAFSQAWMNAAGEIVDYQQQIASAAMRQWWAMANLFNPLTALSAPLTLMKAPIDLLAVSHQTMSITPRVAHGVVKPIHAKATSNARRLGRKKP